MEDYAVQIDENLKRFKFKSARKKKVKFEYLSKREFSKVKKTVFTKVVGSTKLKKADEDTEDVLMIGDEWFVVNEQKKFGIKGYIPVGSNRFIQYKGFPFLALLVPLIIALVVVGIVLLYNPSSLPIGGTIGFKEPALEASASSQEETQIPVYPNIEVSAENTTVPFSNPEGNTVYFQYQITEGDQVLFESDYVAPGYYTEWEAAQSLTKGVHNIKINIRCFDVDSNAECCGTSIETTIHYN